MLGRGNRSKAGQYVGWVYMIGKKKLKKATFDGFVNQPTNIDFKDCARLIRLWRFVHAKKTSNAYVAIKKQLLKFLAKNGLVMTLLELKDQIRTYQGEFTAAIKAIDGDQKEDL